MWRLESAFRLETSVRISRRSVAVNHLPISHSRPSSGTRQGLISVDRMLAFCSTIHSTAESVQFTPATDISIADDIAIC